ncbi:glycosyltransferase family 20 protein, partial [Gonapodya prolifera JEL478]
MSFSLQITINKKEGGGWSYQMSSGGLVSALSGLKKELDFLWVGWPGLELSEEDASVVSQDLAEKFNAIPVYLSDKTAELHYNGFSNSILWPLFHYQPGEMLFDEAAWEGYQKANEEFARVITEILRDGDHVWVRDRDESEAEAMGNFAQTISIGFFLHTPFPSSEIYRVLPVRREILFGVLQSDLIGFHTYDYARHFLSACTRVLGLHAMPNGVVFEGRLVRVGTFPIGIDPEKFENQLSQEATKRRINELSSQFKGIKVIVGVDRLDYIKGVPKKFEAFELFLTRHPEWREKVVLVQVAVPSRQDVEEYANLRSKVNELVGRVNGKFGTVTYQPIHFLHRSVDFTELVALYAMADACLVTSSRDGMNLVSCEYIASQSPKAGVLILSEFAGAAQSLNGAIVVNPWSSSDVSEAIKEALEAPEYQRRARLRRMTRYVKKYTAAFWGTSFVSELTRISSEYDAQVANRQRLKFREVAS